VLTEFPTETRILQNCEPVYETLPGWRQPTGEVRSWKKLPPIARQYLEYLESVLKVPVKIISVGSKRSQTIFRDR
jgi:adenylosuccinate synthase